ncbi:hypothetical protein BVRB_7g157830 [Beta vulgaris subsp. vulgaris]|nr:hypothetical protein BVRB_7g157830 [Beta vulgaris subsp. vulgaris]
MLGCSNCNKIPSSLFETSDQIIKPSEQMMFRNVFLDCDR